MIRVCVDPSDLDGQSGIALRWISSSSTVRNGFVGWEMREKEREGPRVAGPEGVQLRNWPRVPLAGPLQSWSLTVRPGVL